MPISNDMSISTPINTDSWYPSKSDASAQSKHVKYDEEPLALLNTAEILALLNASNNALSKVSHYSPIALSDPNISSKAMSPEVKEALIETLNNKQFSNDIDLIEKLVDTIATLLSSQVYAGGQLMRNNGNDKPDATVPLTRTSSTASPQSRALPAVEGGTDITAPSAGSFSFVNLMGDAELVTALIAVLTVLNRQEALGNYLSAVSAKNTMHSADLAGQKGVSAAGERLSGAWMSGMTNFALQAASTARSCSVLKKESASITNNLGRSRQIDRQLSAGGKDINPLALSEERDMLLGKHDLAGKNTASVLQQSELLKQTGHTMQSTINGGYDVNAAGQTREGELARAAQSLNSELGNVQGQMAKKASEGESSLRQSVAGIFSSNNEAVAAIASRVG